MKLNKKQLKRAILLILIIVNCITIFKFSSEKSEQSNQTSGKIVEFIVEKNPKNKYLSEPEKQKKKEEIVTPVRKTAHFTIYTSLGVLLYLFINTFEIKHKNKIIISIILAFLYACSDEIHQSFVPGRSCEFRDVCIDTLGSLFGVCVIYIGRIVYNKILKNKLK